MLPRRLNFCSFVASSIHYCSFNVIYVLLLQDDTITVGHNKSIELYLLSFMVAVKVATNTKQSKTICTNLWHVVLVHMVGKCWPSSMPAN
jgi:hypothetical protein